MLLPPLRCERLRDALAHPPLPCSYVSYLQPPSPCSYTPCLQHLHSCLLKLQDRDCYSSDSIMAGRRQRFLDRHRSAVNDSVADITKSLNELQASKSPDLYGEIFVDFVKDVSSGRTVVLATSNALDDWYRKDLSTDKPLPLKASTKPRETSKAASLPKVPLKSMSKLTRKSNRKQERPMTDDDERETRWTVASRDGSDLKPQPGPGLVLYKDGTEVLVHEFLGEDRTEMIVSTNGRPQLSRSKAKQSQMQLHEDNRQQPILSLPSLSSSCHLHPWQQAGAWKTVVSCRGPMRGVLNVSKMGNGKTRETLVAIEYARTIGGMKGSFDLVLTPRSCLGQWVSEVEKTFAPVSTPNLGYARI